MSKLYELTKQIHTELKRVEEKIGIGIDFDFDFAIKEKKSRDGTDWIVYDSMFIKDDGDISLFQDPQIRQILIALQEALGKYQVLDYFQKWLNYKIWDDDVDTLFKREPETVLKELLEILKSI